MIHQYVTAFRAMGCQFQIWLETEADGRSILRQAPAWVEAIEARLSRFRQESELSQLNARSGRWVPVSDLLLEVITKAKQAARMTEGLYNPLVLPALITAGYDRSFEEIGDRTHTGESHYSAASSPISVSDWQDINIDSRQQAVRLPAGAQIDLGGIAKGWTAERLAERLGVYGACLVDAGGDIVARGRPQGQDGWQVAVAEPGDTASNALFVTIRDAAVATSGVDYRRWQQGNRSQHHLIDPRTGQPAVTDIQTATVIHPRAAMAEAYTKALILLGSQGGLAWLNRQWKGAGMIIRDDGAILATTKFQMYVASAVSIIEE